MGNSQQDENDEADDACSLKKLARIDVRGVRVLVPWLQRSDARRHEPIVLRDCAHRKITSCVVRSIRTVLRDREMMGETDQIDALVKDRACFEGR
jgi:hypothetical protein